MGCAYCDIISSNIEVDIDINVDIDVDVDVDVHIHVDVVDVDVDVEEKKSTSMPTRTGPQKCEDRTSLRSDFRSQTSTRRCSLSHTVTA